MIFERGCAYLVKRILLVAALIFGIAGAAFCQESSSHPPKNDKKAPPQQSAAPTSVPVDPANPSASYIIGPGDLLAINVLHEPDVSQQKVPVRMDGKITMPLVGEIQASGLMPGNLQAAIAQKLHEYIKDAEVTVVVEEVKSHEFSVMGEVEHPGSFPLVRATRVMDGLAQAGGFRDFAKITKIRVLRRNADGKTTTLPFNYKDVSKGKNEAQNVELQAGDTVIVP